MIHIPLESSRKTTTKFQAALRSFEKNTVGSFVAASAPVGHFCDKQDPHSYLTNGLVSREDILVQAILTAAGTLQQQLSQQ